MRGSIVTNHAGYCVTLAEQGLGLAYIAELNVKDQLREGRLVSVLDAYSATEPGIFLRYPSAGERWARRSSR